MIFQAGTPSSSATSGTDRCCFVVVIAVNGALTWFAVHSDPGLVTEHAFEAGKAYNRVIDAAATQDALGWKGHVAWAGDEVPAEVRATRAFRHAFRVASTGWLVGNLVRAVVRLWLLSLWHGGTLPLAVYLIADTVAGWPGNPGQRRK